MFPHQNYEFCSEKNDNIVSSICFALKKHKLSEKQFGPTRQMLCLCTLKIKRMFCMFIMKSARMLCYVLQAYFDASEGKNFAYDTCSVSGGFVFMFTHLLVRSYVRSHRLCFNTDKR